MSSKGLSNNRKFLSNTNIEIFGDYYLDLSMRNLPLKKCLVKIHQSASITIEATVDGSPRQCRSIDLLKNRSVVEARLPPRKRLVDQEFQHFFDETKETVKTEQIDEPSAKRVRRAPVRYSDSKENTDPNVPSTSTGRTRRAPFKPAPYETPVTRRRAKQMIQKDEESKETSSKTNSENSSDDASNESQSPTEANPKRGRKAGQAKGQRKSTTNAKLGKGKRKRSISPDPDNVGNSKDSENLVADEIQVATEASIKVVAEPVEEVVEAIAENVIEQIAEEVTEEVAKEVTEEVVKIVTEEAESDAEMIEVVEIDDENSMDVENIALLHELPFFISIDQDPNVVDNDENLQMHQNMKPLWFRSIVSLQDYLHKNYSTKPIFVKESRTH